MIRQTIEKDVSHKNLTFKASCAALDKSQRIHSTSKRGN